MATNDPFGNQDWGQQPPHSPPPRQGMSSGTKTVLIILIVLGGLALVCCGGGVITVVYFGRQFANAVSQDPQVVEQVTQRIIGIDVPKPLEPTMSFDMKVPFTDQPLMTWVVYADKASNSILNLGVFGLAADEASRRQMQQQMEQSLRQQGIDPEGDQPGNWQSQSSEKQIEIRGEKVTFHFTTRTNPENDQKRLSVTGTVPGTQGPVVLSLAADSQVVSEEQAVKMLESIK